ncbi:MAG TPA: hypothetical protein VKB46_08745 [Pyrinomonadaceae bacterium]|nr:hypothetical protein [Pyrinomonadaceae bacterium]
MFRVHYKKLLVVVAILIAGSLALLFGQRLGQRPRRTTAQGGKLINVPAGADFQAALNKAEFGDTIVLQAGATYQTKSGFTLPYKGPGTGTDADYITIQTSNLAGIAAANERLDPAKQAAAMPKLVGTGQDSVIRTEARAHHYKLIGLEMTGSGSTYLADLVSLGDGEMSRADRRAMTNFVVDRCFIHPHEVSATELLPSSVTRSSGRGIAIQVVEGWVINSYIAGFAGKFSTSPTESIDSYGIYSVSGPGPLHILNNYIEAQFNNVFTGGGTNDTPNTAKMSNMTESSGTFSNVANLSVGDYVAMRDEHANNVGPNEKWQVAKVNSISGNNVTFTIERGQYSAQLGVPDNGGEARWNGDHVKDVEIRGNTISKPDVWGTSVTGNTTNTGFPNAYKSYIELKDCVDCSITGNSFYSGVGTAMAFTVRNQYGSAPWLTIRNLVFQNNLIDGYQNNAFGIQLRDNERPSINGGDVLIVNNLIINERSSSGSSAFFTLNGARGITFSHNTILQSGKLWAGGGWPSTGVVLKDNIVQSGAYGPTCDNNPPNTIASCFPSYATSHNVIVDTRNERNPPLSSVISGSNFYPVSRNAVGFVDPAKGNYQLSPSSPYKGKASDGKDPGVDMAALLAALKSS